MAIIRLTQDVSYQARGSGADAWNAAQEKAPRSRQHTRTASLKCIRRAPRWWPTLLASATALLPLCDWQPALANAAALRVERYRLEVSFDPDAQTISGSSALSLIWRRWPPGHVVLDMASSLRAHAVTLDGHTVNSTHKGTKLPITLPRGVSGGHEHVLRILYRGKPNSRYLHFHTVAGEPAIASYGLPFSAMQWWPTLDEPSLKAGGADIFITAPKGTIAASNGTLSGINRLSDGRPRFHFQESSPIYADVVSVAIGRYEVIRGSYRSASGREVPLRYYVYPADKLRAEAEFAVVPRILRVYESLFGPYPFPGDKYGIAEVPFPSFREHQTIPSLGRGLILGTSPIWDLHDIANVIAHDMAHQWFGDSLTPRHWSDVWLNEAFANYAVALWHERQSGEAAYHKFMQSLDTGSFEGSVYVAPGQPTGELLTYTTFNKGAWVLHMLRHVMGDRAFFAALRQYAQANRGGVVDTGTWEASCEHTYGHPLGWFFDEWIYGKGRPSLRMNWKTTAGSDIAQLQVRVEQTQSTPLFIMPLDLEWRSAGELERQTVWLRRRRETFTFPLSAPASTVMLDPAGWMLRN